MRAMPKAEGRASGSCFRAEPAQFRGRRVQTRMAAARRPVFSAFGISVTFHAALLVVLILLASAGSEQIDSKSPPVRTELVFLQHAGPGGGGGGSPTPAPPAKIEVPPPHPTAVALVPPDVVAPAPPPPSLDAPVEANAAALLGNGVNPFAAPAPGGGGRGKGLGPGDGNGLDAGNDRGTGGGDPRPGGFTQPFPIREVKPEYTGPALQAKVQGSVTLEVEVLANGTVGYVKVLKSLDRSYGLDAQAIRAARQWVFRPATAGGKPVDSVVQLILDFHLR